MAKPDKNKNGKGAENGKDEKPVLSQAEIDKAEKHKARRVKDQKKAVLVKAAKAVLKTFSITAVAKKLPEDVLAAIVLLTSKSERTRGANWLDLFNTIFPEVGSSITELDLFLKTKMGRGEFRRKVQYAIKKTEPENRFWVSFDEKAETWTLKGKGADAPEGFEA